MSLALVVSKEDYAGLDENLQKLYVEGKEGEYYVDADAATFEKHPKGKVYGKAITDKKNKITELERKIAELAARTESTDDEPLATDAATKLSQIEQRLGNKVLALQAEIASTKATEQQLRKVDAAKSGMLLAGFPLAIAETLAPGLAAKSHILDDGRIVIPGKSTDWKLTEDFKEMHEHTMGLKTTEPFSSMLPNKGSSGDGAAQSRTSSQQSGKQTRVYTDESGLEIRELI